MSPDWIGAVAALLGALGAVKWGPGAFRFFRRIVTFLDDWSGTPPRDGVPGRPGVMARLAAVETTTADILAETRPNGGGSLRDAVNAVRQDVAEHREAVGPQITALTTGMGELRERTELFEQQREDRDREEPPK